MAVMKISRDYHFCIASEKKSNNTLKSQLSPVVLLLITLT